MSDLPTGPQPPADPWAALRRHTPARIALGRSGAALPTHELLRFAAAHAQARDAVHVALDVPALQADLASAGWASTVVHSRAAAVVGLHAGVQRQLVGRQQALRTALDGHLTLAPPVIATQPMT